MKTLQLFQKNILMLLLLCPLWVAAQHQAIGRRTFKFTDASRNRPLTTEVWYPTNDAYHAADSTFEYPFIHIPSIRNAAIPLKKYPLVMISHGTGGGRITLEWLADALVQKGFIVAAVDHWGNTYDNKIAIDFVTPWQRPRDISFVLTQLFGDKDFGPVIDKNRIGAAGFSIGGYTVIALAGAKLNLDALVAFSKTPQGVKETSIPEFPNAMQTIGTDSGKVIASFRNSPDLKDSRIKAFFAICPAIGQGFTSADQFNRISAPLYIIGAQSDSIAPVKTNALHYHNLIKGSKLTIIPGKTGHYVFLNEGTEATKKGSGIYMNDDPSVNRRAVHKQVGDLAVGFFLKNL